MMIHIIFMIIGILTAIVFVSFLTKDTSYIHFKFRYIEDLNINSSEVISDSSIAKVKEITKSWYTGGKISTYAYVDIKDISIKEEKDGYVIDVDQNSFILMNKDGQMAYNDTAAKGFLKHLVLVSLDQEIIDDYNTKYSYQTEEGKDILGISTIFDNEYYEANSLKDNRLIYSSNHLTRNRMLLFAPIGLASGLLLSIIFCIIFIGKFNMDITHEYDNKEIYRTPFHLKFWKDSLKTFKDLKTLVLISVLLALTIISKFIPIPSGFGDLGIGLGYLFLSIACMLTGPIPALMIGALSDILGFFTSSRGGDFFIGYTLQAMLACFSYGLCFYKTHVTFSKVLLARVFVNFICNVLIGSICYGIIYGLNGSALWTYMVTISLPKNLIYLLPQSLLLYFVIRAVTIPMSAMNLVNTEIADNVSFF